MAWVAPTGDARHVPKCGIVCRRFCPGLTQDVITRHQHEQKSLRNGSVLATDTAHARATRPTAPRATAGPPVKLQVQQAASPPRVTLYAPIPWTRSPERRAGCRSKTQISVF